MTKGKEVMEGGEREGGRWRRRKGGGGGGGSRIIFHLCAVDVLINSVRFSFWRPCGVLHADSRRRGRPALPNVNNITNPCALNLFMFVPLLKTLQLSSPILQRCLLLL